jgi:hypothetical protein
LLISYGGGGGNVFQSAQNPRGVERIEVRYGVVVDAIRLTFRDGTQSEFFGGDGGDQLSSFTVPPAAPITEVAIRHGEEIDALTFVTSAGERSQTFGGDGGSLDVAKAPAGTELLGIQGQDGSRIDQIQFVWGFPERVTAIDLRLIPIFEFSGFSLGCGFQSVTTTRGHFSSSATSTSSVSASVKASGLLDSVFSNSGMTASASASMTASLQATGELQTISNNIFALFLIPTYVYQTKVIVKMSSGDVHEYSDGSYIQSNVPLSVTQYEQNF